MANSDRLDVWALLIIDYGNGRYYHKWVENSKIEMNQNYRESITSYDYSTSDYSSSPLMYSGIRLPNVSFTIKCTATYLNEMDTGLYYITNNINYDGFGLADIRSYKMYIYHKNANNTTELVSFRSNIKLRKYNEQGIENVMDFNELGENFIIYAYDASELSVMTGIEPYEVSDYVPIIDLEKVGLVLTDGNYIKNTPDSISDKINKIWNNW